MLQIPNECRKCSFKVECSEEKHSPCCNHRHFVAALRARELRKQFKFQFALEIEMEKQKKEGKFK